MNQSTNYNFNLPEGTDLVNLLTQLIPNWNSLDGILKGVENQAFTNCTEVTSLGVHAISRTNADGKILKWVATANFTAGDTFTVDGNVVAASTPSGGTLATNAYVTGSVIIAALNSDESAMTVFVTGSNVAADSERLGGELPSYYAKDSDMAIAQQDITDLDNLMGTTSISAIGDGTVTGAISTLNSKLTLDGIVNTLLSATSDINIEKSIDTTGYKYIVINVTFPSADKCSKIYSVDVLNAYAINGINVEDVFANALPSSDNYYARARVLIKASSVNLRAVYKGSSVGAPTISVEGIK